MKGLDGNYLNTQGDASARMQVAYQSEQNRQQIRAQLEAVDTLRKLREQVNETEKKNGSGGPAEVKDDSESNQGNYSKKDESLDGDAKREKGQKEERDASPFSISHIDVRV